MYHAYGGAIYALGNIKIENNQVIQNSIYLQLNWQGLAGAFAYGGGIYSTGIIDNNIIQGNACICNVTGNYSPFMTGEADAECYGGGFIWGCGNQ